MDLNKVVRAYLSKKGNILKFPDTMPPSLAAIDLEKNPLAWAEEFMSLLKATFKLKGKIGVVKEKKSILGPGFEFKSGKYGMIVLSPSPSWPKDVRYMPVDGGLGLNFTKVNSVEELYAFITKELGYIPYIQKAEEYSASFLKNSGLAWTSQVYKYRSSVKVNISSPPGSADRGHLRGELFYGDKTGEEWELLWPGAQGIETFTNFEDVLDFIPEEFDDEGILFLDKKLFTKEVKKKLHDLYKEEGITATFPVWLSGSKNRVVLQTTNSSIPYRQTITLNSDPSQMPPWEIKVRLSLYLHKATSGLLDSFSNSPELKQMASGALTVDEDKKAISFTMGNGYDTWYEVLRALESLNSTLKTIYRESL